MSSFGNVGHFDSVKDLADVEDFPGIKVETIKHQAGRSVFPDGHGVKRRRTWWSRTSPALWDAIAI